MFLRFSANFRLHIVPSDLRPYNALKVIIFNPTHFENYGPAIANVFYLVNYLIYTDPTLTAINFSFIKVSATNVIQIVLISTMLK